MINKLLRLITRRSRARKLGFHYIRSSGFIPPNKIRILDKDVSLKFPNETGVANDFLSIFLDDDYNLEKIDWNVTTVLDIGANLGFFSLAARKAFPQAEIHAYEPNKQLDVYLDSHSYQGNFKIFYQAVGLESGRVSLDILGESNQTRSRKDEDGIVHQISFRETIEKLGGNVDIVKIDCEGAEWEFLEDQNAWKNVKFLTMEYHLWPGERKHSDIIIALNNLGFTIIKTFPIENYGLIHGIRR